MVFQYNPKDITSVILKKKKKNHIKPYDNINQFLIHKSTRMTAVCISNLRAFVWFCNEEVCLDGFDYIFQIL